MMLLKNKRSYTPDAGRKLDPLSKTIPDQALTLRQLLDRYAKGMPLVGNPATPVYDGPDVDLPDWKTLDLAEREDLIKNNQAEIDSIQRKLSEQEAKKAAKKALDEERRTQEDAEKAAKQAELEDSKKAGTNNT